MILKNLQNHKIILASQSPRRHHLLKSIGLEFDILSGIETDESFPADVPVHEVSVYLAKKKAKTFEPFIDKNTILITADTVVIIKNQILNKPVDYDDAVKMLKTLSGNKHTVSTGVCISSKNKQKYFNVFTDVFFNNLDDNEIHYYVDKFQPFDKAGAYGIQEWIGYIGIKKIEGSYFNVMGLPVQKLYEVLKLF